MVKRRYNRHKKKEKARRSSNVRTHAAMQKGLEPRDTQRVCRLGLRDNSLGLLQNARHAEMQNVKQGVLIQSVTEPTLIEVTYTARRLGR